MKFEVKQLISCFDKYEFKIEPNDDENNARLTEQTAVLSHKWDLGFDNSAINQQ